MATEVANMGLGTGNPFLGQNNPYLQANIDAATGDLVNNFNLTARPAMNAAMVKSGSFGNSALGELDNQAQSTLQKNIGNLSNAARMQDYQQQQGMYQWQKGFDENSRQFDLGFGRNIFNDAYSQSRNDLSVGMGLLGGLAGTNASDINSATTQQNTPLNYYSQFANLAGGIGNGYGTTTTGTTSNPIATAAGGAQLGNAAMNWWNQQGSQPISSSNQAGFDSFGASNGWWGTAG